MTLALPDCTHRTEAFSLSAEDRRELVRRIAEHGPDAIDAFVREREAAGDSLIARKVQKLRDELLRRADELRRRLADDFGGRRQSLEAEYAARVAALEGERAGLERLRGSDEGLLELALQGDPILGVALQARRPPWWRRAWAFVLRALRLLLFPIAWVWRKLSPRRERAPDRVLLASGLLDHAGAAYLSDPRFRARVKQRLRAAPPAERVRRAWERLLGVEDYESLARKAMTLMLAEDAERARRERDAGLSQKLAEVMAREEEERARLATSRDALAAAEERDARALEEALRNAPELEVKEAIVDELKAAGLLREAAGGLAPTLALIDRFASVVYDDEMRAAGGRAGGATGDYAEGEGHYIRGPMRASVEVSRMDIPATLLRARSTHPHVKHLTDADVVVYREERTSALHVVLIVDRSGSMEENGRMEAAKRAALALHHAVRARNPRNRVDLLLMDTSVRAASLRDVWETEPTGFTNTGAALRMAREGIRRRKSDRALVYLVTDGLPEAYTKDHEDVAGHPDKAMAYAKEQARLLRRERAVAGFVMLLLEPEDKRHVAAAQALAKEAGGRVLDVDPGALTRTLVKQFEAERPAADRARQP